MQFSLISIFLLIVSAVLVLLGLNLLFARNWFLQFARGFVGFGLILCAFFIMMVGINFSTYAQIKEGQDLATVSFTKLSEQSYEVTIASVQNGDQEKYTLEGDLWAIDSRILRLEFKSVDPFYKLNTLSSRFYSIEQDRESGKKTVHINSSTRGFDIWSILQVIGILPFSADFVKSTFAPMDDGAVYTVSTSTKGLQAKPVNEAAKNISQDWK